MAYRKLTAEEHRLAIMRGAKSSASPFTAGGKRRETRPITLATTPWKDDDKKETKEETKEK